jgi:hypothetical protein
VSLLCPLHHDDRIDHLGGRIDIEIQGFAVLGRSEDRRVGERHLEFVKCLLGLDGLGETLMLLQEPIEGQALFAEPRNEAAQGGKAPQHLLDAFEVPNRAHLVEGCDLLGVGLDASLGNHIPQ